MGGNLRSGGTLRGEILRTVGNLIVGDLGDGGVLLRCGRVRRRKEIWDVSEKGERRAGGLREVYECGRRRRSVQM